MIVILGLNRAYGNDSSLVRKLFTKSLNAVPASDWPEFIVKQWLQFEREEGDLTTMEHARLKYETSGVFVIIDNNNRFVLKV